MLTQNLMYISTLQVTSIFLIIVLGNKHSNLWYLAGLLICLMCVLFGYMLGTLQTANWPKITPLQPTKTVLVANDNKESVSTAKSKKLRVLANI